MVKGTIEIRQERNKENILPQFTNLTPIEEIMMTFSFEKFSDETFDLPIFNPENVILSAPITGWIVLTNTLRNGLVDYLNDNHDNATYVAGSNENLVFNFIVDMGTNYDATVEICQHDEAPDGYYVFIDLGDEYNQYQFVLNNEEVKEFISFLEESVLLNHVDIS